MMAGGRSQGLLLACALLCGAAQAAGDAGKSADGSGAHRFAVIARDYAEGGEARLKHALAALDGDTAFAVVTGIKDAAEACSDRLYQRRRELLDAAPLPVVVVPAAADWTACRNSAGRSNAIERLNRIRELFYAEPQSLGRPALALTRQSLSPRFRSYAENAHWAVGKVLYASLNLPANNNHYVLDAGRNSEYEDRLVANRYWLNRLFAIARRDRMDAIVLFAEGDLKALSQPTGLRALLRRAVADNDGFAQTRRQTLALAQKFRGKVLLVDSTPLARDASPAIEWRGNLGHLPSGRGEIAVAVAPGTRAMFRVSPAADRAVK